MVIAGQCPDRSLLARYLRAELPDEDASGLEVHLEQCDSCIANIHELSSADSLMKDLGGGEADASCSEEHEVDELAEGFCRVLPGLIAPRRGNESTDLVPDQPAMAGREMQDTEEIFGFFAPAEQPGEIGRLGPYRVSGQIGAGGMGVVFRAEDVLLKRAVALKVMRGSLAASEPARRRFLHEAQAVAALEHDHIVAIYQAGEDRGVLFLAMPLLQGETLADRLRREGRLPLTEALRVAREVAEGLDLAHQRGLVHRDIKPANIWLEAKRGRVKILDFGLSRSLEPEANQSQSVQVAGTPHYMSPEAARSGTITPLGDLFSLGCVFYHMTTGRVPFDGKDIFAVLTALAEATLEPPHRLNPELPPAASALITSLLSRDLTARPRSARAVVEAIEAIENSPTPVATKNRRRWLIAVSLLLALGVLAMGVTLGPQVFRLITDQGQLVVETSDPDVRVEVRRGGQLVTVADSATGRRVDLKAGDYDLELSEGKDGLRLSTSRFALRRGGREVVRVTRESSPITATRDGEISPVLTAGVVDSRQEIERLDARLRVSPNDADALQKRADANWKLGDHDRTIADLTRAIAIEPTASRYQSMGWARMKRDGPNLALVDFREGLRLYPNNGPLHSSVGKVHQMRGEDDRALSEYNEAVRLDPSSSPGFHARGDFHLSRGDLDAALVDLDSAIRLDRLAPKINPRSGAFIARAEARRRKGDLDGALSDANEAVRLDPDLALNYRGRAAVYSDRKDHQARLADLDRCLRLDPNDAYALADRCTANLALGEFGKALADGDASIRLNPDFPWAYHFRGLVHAARGEDDLAIADYTESLRRDPNLVYSLQRRAEIYEKRGEDAPAKADREAADRHSKSGTK